MIDPNPTWYIYSMHFTAILTFPVNLFGAFVILFCQRTQLASLRWHLLTFQICSMTTDFFINIGSLPVIYTPLNIGRSHGLFNWFYGIFGYHDSAKAQCIIVFTSLYITAGSVELLFFLRYQAILPLNHPHKLTTVTSLLLLSFYQLLHIILLIVTFNSATPNQQEARAQFLRLHPELQYLLVDDQVYILCVIVELVHVIFLFSCFFRLGIGLATVILLIWMSSRALHKFNLSVRTRKMHLQLIRSLCYQISIPIVAFYVPLLIVIAPLMFAIPNSQMSFFISVLIMSFHTFLGTLSMFYFNGQYRHWLVSTIKNRTLMTSFPASKLVGSVRNASVMF